MLLEPVKARPIVVFSISSRRKMGAGSSETDRPAGRRDDLPCVERERLDSALIEMEHNLQAGGNYLTPAFAATRCERA